MIVNAVELLNVLRKVRGVVADNSVVEELKAFHLLPENGILKVAGTDSNMTILEKVEYKESENSDGTRLVLSADKIMDVVKYAGHEVEFVYTAEDEGVKIKTPKSSVTLFKHFSLDDDIINFELDKENDFVDEFTVNQFKFILSSLSTIIDSSVSDPSFKTIFLNGTLAVVGDESTISTIECVTNEKYEFSVKVVKQILTLLSGLDGESKVKLKKYADGNKVLLATDSDVLSFGLADVVEPDLEVMTEFSAVASVLVSKEELTRAIHLVKSTSEEDKVNVELKETAVELTSFFEGEEAKDEIDVVKHQIKQVVKFESLASQLIKLISIIDSEGVVIEVDNESSILIVREPKKKVSSAISVRI